MTYKSQTVHVRIPDDLHTALLARSTKEGRSLSNLCAFLLGRAMLAEEEAKTGEVHAGHQRVSKRVAKSIHEWG